MSGVETPPSGGLSRREAFAAGALTLVSFLATQPDTAATASRSQAVELVSLAHQYGSKGVHVVIVTSPQFMYKRGRHGL